jgi:hypothetical protein
MQYKQQPKYLFGTISPFYKHYNTIKSRRGNTKKKITTIHQSNKHTKQQRNTLKSIPHSLVRIVSAMSKNAEPRPTERSRLLLVILAESLTHQYDSPINANTAHQSQHSARQPASGGRTQTLTHTHTHKSISGAAMAAFALPSTLAILQESKRRRHDKASIPLFTMGDSC